MLKKSLLLGIGGVVFVIGMILFPLPVPFGLPVMIIGLAIMFKASNQVKRKVIRLADKHPRSREVWQKIRKHRLHKKQQRL